MMSIGMSARRTYSGTFDPTFGPWAILFAGTVVVLDEMSGDRVTLLLVPFRPGIPSAPFPFDDIQYSGNISEEIRNLGTDLSHALILHRQESQALLSQYAHSKGHLIRGRLPEAFAALPRTDHDLLRQYAIDHTLGNSDEV